MSSIPAHAPAIYQALKREQRVEVARDYVVRNTGVSGPVAQARKDAPAHEQITW
jgi:hypothetical protein